MEARCFGLWLLVACCFIPVQSFMPRPSKQVNCCPHTAQNMKDVGCSSWVDSRVGTSSSNGRCSRGSTSLSSTISTADGTSDVESTAVSKRTGTKESDMIGNGVNVGAAAMEDVGRGAKDELISLVSEGMLDFSSPMKRASVNELLLRLEALNPTPMPAYSSLLNGAWEFLWTGGISPGILGLQLASRLSTYASGAVEVGETVLTISRAQPRVEVQTSLKVFGRENRINIRTRLEPASGLRLEETYTEASMGNLRVPFPDQEQIFKRPLFVSYLDDDLLVVRDSFGAPDILMRKDKAFLSNTGVPSATDDDTSPGAG